MWLLGWVRRWGGLDAQLAGREVDGSGVGDDGGVEVSDCRVGGLESGADVDGVRLGGPGESGHSDVLRPGPADIPWGKQETGQLHRDGFVVTGGDHLVSADHAGAVVSNPEVVHPFDRSAVEFTGGEGAGEVSVEPEALGDRADRDDAAESSVESVEQFCGGHAVALSDGWCSSAPNSSSSEAIWS